MVPGNFYHIYNHANGRENLFVEPKNYHFFLNRLSFYILPFVKLHAFCLLPNHFHLLISVKEIDALRLLKDFNTFQDLPREKLQPLIEKKLSKCFANLFSSYTLSFNKIYQRKGSLFMPNMKCDLIEDEAGICKVVQYIHANPVHHGFVTDPEKWKFSSYSAYISKLFSKLSKEEIIEIFGGIEYFITYHRQPINLKTKLD